jgi:hypothetical protein
MTWQTALTALTLKRQIMVFTFTSKAGADILMLAQHAKPIFELIGKEPSERGILDVEQMPSALQALKQAIGDEKFTGNRSLSNDEIQTESHDADIHAVVSLHQRAWPLVQMIERALELKEAVVWSAR